MIKKLLAVSISSVLIMMAPGFVNAQGDIDAGETKAAACASCHGEDGNSMVPSYPKLAGQHESYLVKQLEAFKDNSRDDPMMAPYAMGLDEESMADIAAYYASKKISSNKRPVMEDSDDDDDEEENSGKSDQDKKAELDELLTLGSDLYRNGDLKRKVSACIACHGPYGDGNKPASFPSLRGQHVDYLIKALNDFKKDARNVDPYNMMHMIAKKMTDKEIQAVAYHISMMKKK
jgi:cytochrome c553